ncbi:DivIVA domain-containing protein [Lactobacillus mulieris]|uniref:DivIVA domain-containing protein n=1 Tax=Lactobacillus mulieris TaxID=2508708 RepID=UPI001432E7CE|nr:DivIVA domain-containing protein [Lactobacillus mulieris]MCF1783231.1 DivIVA domain-containing protein [Lactobacillus mulieris]MCW8103980.1 DivIVA domain-containing protein [Lactobacillus mulieris]MDK6803048.1 DivIVA domain-containing protein [Lactobacillus mulieris]MDK8382144.1 DivIVA domain-containing protein [Lactobacillus mulieris]MDT9620205.1 DivIVA domain-containing protein [Lactobacillus mulieris]
MAQQEKKNLLTPMDIHNKEFAPRGHKGYDRYEVDSFLDQIVDDYGDCLDNNVDLKNENIALKNKIKELESEVAKLTQLRKSINDEVLNAQKDASELRRKARVNARKIIEEAKATAKAENQSLMYQNDTLKTDYQRLKTQVADFRNTIRTKLQKQIDALDDNTWQYYLDVATNMERIYPADGGEPIPVSSLPTVDNTTQSDVNLEHDEKNSVSSDTQKKDISNSGKPDVTIVFPDDYKDHN